MKKTLALIIAFVLIMSLAVNAVATNPQSIVLGNAKFTEKDEVQTVSVEANDLDTLSVIYLVLSYDSEKVELLDVVEEEEGYEPGQVKNSAGSLIPDATVCRPEEGIITLIWESTAPVSGSGVLANLSFKALSDDAGLIKLSLAVYDGEESYVGRDDAYNIPRKVAIDFVEAPSGAAVSGTVTSYLDSAEIITIGLYEGENAEPSYETTVTGNSAEYSISEVAAGTYTMKISKANHVTREYEVVVGTDDVVQNVKICPIGDANCNGSINLMDYRKILQHVRGSKITDEYELLCADANQNGSINLMDYRKVLQHIRGTSMWT